MYPKTFEKSQYADEQEIVQASATFAGIGFLVHCWTLLALHFLAGWSMPLDSVVTFHSVILLSLTIYYLPYFYARIALYLKKRRSARQLPK